MFRFCYGRERQRNRIWGRREENLDTTWFIHLLGVFCTRFMYAQLKFEMECLYMHMKGAFSCCTCCQKLGKYTQQLTNIAPQAIKSTRTTTTKGRKKQAYRELFKTQPTTIFVSYTQSVPRTAERQHTYKTGNRSAFLLSFNFE